MQGKNVPKRKRLLRQQRIHDAKTRWLKQIETKNLVKSYSKWYGVDKLCALRELEILGFHFSEEYKLLVKQSIEVIAKQKKVKKLNQYKEDFLESDETFAFIAGYTPGGVPYGITHIE